jgi:hypothetical protein
MDEVLAAMDAAELREVVRDVLLEHADRTNGRVTNSLTERAARGNSGSAPPAPAHDEVAEVAAFLRAKRVGYTEIVRRAGVDRIPGGRARAAVSAAMRKAAERRIVGVTEQKRRGHYAHAAELVAICFACDRSPEAAQWAATVRQAYRQFPALRAELEERLGSA